MTYEQLLSRVTDYPAPVPDDTALRTNGSEVERLKSELEGLTRRAAAKDRIICELIAANEKIIASAPLTADQRAQLAGYVTEYLDRGIHGVWYELATGIAALMADNERLRNLPNDKLNHCRRKE